MQLNNEMKLKAYEIYFKTRCVKHSSLRLDLGNVRGLSWVEWGEGGFVCECGWCRREKRKER